MCRFSVGNREPGKVLEEGSDMISSVGKGGYESGMERRLQTRQQSGHKAEDDRPLFQWAVEAE